MRSFWKFFVPLALVLPLGAFVTGSLVASAADDQPVRHTIVIKRSSGTPTADPSGTATTRPSHTPSDHVDTVTVEPDDVDDDSGPQAPYEDHPDNSGPGSSGSSGHGGGGDD